MTLQFLSILLAIAFALYSVPQITTALSLIHDEWGKCGFGSAVWMTARGVLNCFKCVSFWVALCFTHDFVLAMNMALVGYWITK